MITAANRPEWDDSNAQHWREWWQAAPKDELAAKPCLPPRGTIVSEPAAIMIALAYALRGIGWVTPNPLVGCVVLSKDRRFLNAGAHLRYGQDHAEIQALKVLTKADLEGAHVYVTLEPCSHIGQTPPCAKALAALPIASVKYLLEDPNPKVNGAGARLLAEAGKSVSYLTEWQDLAEDLAEVFVLNQRKKRPFVGLKLASTSSGVYALADSSRHWITGPRARNYGHYLRLRYDGILVGAKTVLLDDPQLNSRHPDLPKKTPWRFVVDPQGEAWNRSEQAALLKNSDAHVIWFVGANAVLKKHSGFKFLGQIKIFPVLENGQFSWTDILTEIQGLGCQSVLLEGGGAIWNSATAAGIVDKVHWFVAPDRPDLANGIKWNQPSWFEQKKKFCFRLEQDDYFEFATR